MRPEKASLLIQKAIDKKLKTGDGSKLKLCMPAMLKLWKRFARQDNDFRTAYESGGFGDEESINNTLLYYSDRWRAAHRIRWIIDAVNAGLL